jgi:sugar phosphate permease
MAVHQTALYAGVVGSGVIAGWLGQHYGWRAAFWAFGAAGLLLAGGLQMRLRETAAPSKENRPRLREVVGTLVRTPSVAFVAAGLGALIFVNVGYLAWMPTHLYERFGLSMVQAGFASMFYHHAAAFCGVLLGGWLSDRIARRRASGRMELQAAALLAGAPSLYWLGSSSTLGGTLCLLGGFGFFRGVYEASIYAALFQVVRPRLHASATALVSGLACLAASLAPVALGAIKQSVGLSTGLSWLAAVYACGGLSLIAGAIFAFPRDLHRMEEGSPHGGQLVSSGR